LSREQGNYPCETLNNDVCNGDFVVLGVKYKRHGVSLSRCTFRAYHLLVSNDFRQWYRKCKYLYILSHRSRLDTSVEICSQCCPR